MVTVENFDKEFEKLSQAQKSLFQWIAVDGKLPYFHWKSLQTLWEKGFIVYFDEEKNVFTRNIRLYKVPAHIHTAWCDWCSRNVTEEDAL